MVEKASGYEGDALLIHGLNDQAVPYTASVEALANLYGESNSELVLLSGKKAVHSFDVVQPELKSIAVDAVLDFLDRHVESSQTEKDN